MAKAPISQTIILTEDGTSITVSVATAVNVPPLVVIPEEPETLPAFASPPSITGTARSGQTLTGNDGTITNGSVSGRRWLRGTTAISGATGGSYLVTDEDVGTTLAYRVTATGAGGQATATSANTAVVAPAVVTPTPTPAPTPAPGVMRTIGTVGQNPASEQLPFYGVDCPFLDRFKASSPFHAGDSGTITLNADGWPTQCSTYAECYVRTERDDPQPGVEQKYVVRTNKTSWGLGIGTMVSETLVKNGTEKRRVFTPSDYVGPHAGPSMYVRLHNINSDPWQDGDYFVILRLDEEARFDAGFKFRQWYIDRAKVVSPHRYMDWCAVNGNHGNIQFSDWPRASAASFTDRVPLEYIVAEANECDSTPWFCVPHAFNDASCRQMIRVIINGRDGHAGLAPHLQIGMEYSNEVWNYAPAFIPQASYCELLRDNLGLPRIGTGWPTYPNYGWRSAQVMAIMHEETGFSGRVAAFLGGQNFVQVVLNGAEEGVEFALAEFRDPASPNYNPTYAAHFKEFGQLYRALGGAVYIDGDIVIRSKEGTTEDKAKIHQWAAMSGDAGIMLAFQQMRLGNLLSPGDGFTLAGFPNGYAQQKAQAERLQVEVWAYEGIPSFEGIPEDLREFAVRIVHHPEMIPFTREWINTLLTQCGYSTVAALCDISGRGGSWGALESAYDLTWPRYVGIQQALANLPAPPPVQIEITTTGPLRVGGNPVTHIKATGGRGPIKVTYGGLAAGRVGGYRTVSGVITADAGDQPGTVTATPEFGASKTVVLPQNIAPPIAGRQMRYARILIQAAGDTDNPNFSVRARELWFVQPDDTILRPSWIRKDAVRPEGEAVPILNDQDLSANTFWTIYDSGGGIGLQADLGSVQSVDGFVWYTEAGSQAPGIWKMWVSDTAMPGLDGSGGTLVIDRSETTKNNWQDNAPRRFSVV